MKMTPIKQGPGRSHHQKKNAIKQKVIRNKGFALTLVVIQRDLASWKQFILSFYFLLVTASSTQNSDYPTPLPSLGSMKSLPHDGNSNGLQSSLTHTCLPGSPNKLPNVGLTKFKPSPDVDMLGVMTSVTQSSQQLVPLSSQEPDKISTPPATPKQIAPVVSTKSLSKKGTSHSCDIK